ncbi:unnamed protein product [Gadus morhua 'NCC']
MDLADTERRRATANPVSRSTAAGDGRGLAEVDGPQIDFQRVVTVRVEPPVCCPGAGGKQLHPSPTTGCWLLLASALSALRSLLSHVAGH